MVESHSKSDIGKILSIIIPNWNGCPLLYTLMLSLGDRIVSKNYEVIFVDDRSDDFSVEMVRSFYPNIKIIKNEKRFGFARTANMGIRAAKGDYVALLNTDIAWVGNWIEFGVEYLEKNASYDYVAPLVLNYYEPDKIDGAGDRINYRFMPLKNGYGKLRVFFAVRDVDIWAASCSAVIFRKSFFDRVGGFDEEFGMYFEDIDIFSRGTLKGAKGRLLVDQVVYHREGGSGELRNKNAGKRHVQRKNFLLIRNRFYFIIKNCPMVIFISLFPFFAFEWIRSLIYWCMKGEFLTFFSAHVDALKTLSLMLEKRKIIQKHRIISPYLYLKRMTWNFDLMGTVSKNIDTI